MDNFFSELNNFLPEDFKHNHKGIIFNDPDLLRKLGNYCAQHLEDPDVHQMLLIIARYSNESHLFLRNTLENEFFSSLALSLGPDRLMEHLNYLPDTLWITYLRVLTALQKTTKS